MMLLPLFELLCLSDDEYSLCNKKMELSKVEYNDLLKHMRVMKQIKLHKSDRLFMKLNVSENDFDENFSSSLPSFRYLLVQHMELVVLGMLVIIFLA